MTGARQTFDQVSQSGSRAFPVSRFWRLFPSGMRRRWWMFRIFDRIVRSWPVFRGRHGVLVVRMDGIGDMVLFRRALDSYAEVFGVDKSEITVLGCTSWESIAPQVFAGYRIVAINEHAFHRHLIYRFKVGLMVRRLAPRITVNDAYFRRALMADSLVWMSAAPETYSSLPYISGRTRAEYTYFLSQVTKVIDTGMYPTHEIDRHFRFLSAMAGRTIEPAAPDISWPRQRSAKIPPNVSYAVLNPGSNEPGRRWPFASYIAIAERLMERGLAVVLIGSSRQIPGGLNVLKTKEGFIDLVGETSLPELMGILSGAALVVTNDTGPAHLAIAVGAPTIVIVGGGHFGSFVPYPEHIRPPHAHFVFHEMPCYHCFWRCHLRENAAESFPCVGAVPVDAVWAVADGYAP